MKETKNSKQSKNESSVKKRKNEDTKKLHEHRLEEFTDSTSTLGITKNVLGKVILVIVIAVLGFFFIKTAVWEYFYYKEKEGSPRATVETSEEAPEPVEVDETEITEKQRAEYFVPADYPRYLSIEKLGIVNARVIELGLTANGELDTPTSIFDAGWYTQSSKPGAGGVMVIDGHNGGPNVEGIFKHLNTLYTDDIITIERGDGTIFKYKVVENKEVPLAEADSYMTTAFTSPEPGKESITIISCIGEWSQVQQTYLSRQFLISIIF